MDTECWNFRELNECNHDGADDDDADDDDDDDDDDDGHGLKLQKRM